MKKRIIAIVVMFVLMLSCKGPHTTITNYVHPDGSILRKVEMKHDKQMFKPQSFSIPVDTTWRFSDSISISSEGDTTWYLFAEKSFENAAAVNETYRADSTSNRSVLRTASFKRSFRWFTTRYYFEEKCGRSLLSGYPLEEYIDKDELNFLKLPEVEKRSMITGSDSLKWRSFSDTIDKKLQEWQLRSLINEWITQTGKLFSPQDHDSLTMEILKENEDSILSFLDSDLDFPDCLGQILGESVYDRYRTELDSARNIADSNFDKSLSFKDYTMQVVMPGRLISTDGYTYPDGRIGWDVSGELFLTSEYIMSARSEKVNYWAVVITILYLASGIVLLTIAGHRRRKAKRQ